MLDDLTRQWRRVYKMNVKSLILTSQKHFLLKNQVLLFWLWIFKIQRKILVRFSLAMYKDNIRSCSKCRQLARFFQFASYCSQLKTLFPGGTRRYFNVVFWAKKSREIRWNIGPRVVPEGRTARGKRSGTHKRNLWMRHFDEMISEFEGFFWSCFFIVICDYRLVFYSRVLTLTEYHLHH